tara:strand:- start:284 stop:412 length:129 start_codon:yes stop_codon:yes gene_type:complete
MLSCQEKGVEVGVEDGDGVRVGDTLDKNSIAKSNQTCLIMNE